MADFFAGKEKRNPSWKGCVRGRKFDRHAALEKTIPGEEEGERTRSEGEKNYWATKKKEVARPLEEKGFYFIAWQRAR